jgi:hypothetical protein
VSLLQRFRKVENKITKEGIHLHFLDVEVHVLVGSQDVWVLGEQVIEELRHDERSFLVLIGCVAEFFLKVLIFGLEVIVIELSFGELYFNLIDLMLQELDEIVLSFGF